MLKQEINKIPCFEFMIDQLIDWVNEFEGEPYKELNLLKVIKLNFFITAASSSEDNPGLLEVFDNFYALPYGHVESSVYTAVKSSNELSKYKITAKGIEIIDDKVSSNSQIGDKYQDLIKTAIEDIKKKDEEFVLKSPMYLVNLSHEWRSWRVMYQIAKAQNKHAIKIPNSLIQTDNKIFILP